MDKTAIYLSLVTIGLAIILSGIVILARRLIQNPEARAGEPKLPLTQVVLYIGGAFVVVFSLIAAPPIGMGLLLAAFLWGIIDFMRMPAERKADLNQRLESHNKKPLVKILNGVSMAIIFLLVIFVLWKKMT